MDYVNSSYLLAGAVVTLHLVCSFFAYGVFFGYFMGKYPTASNKKETKSQALAFCMGGSLSLMVAMIMSEKLKYGLRWR